MAFRKIDPPKRGRLVIDTVRIKNKGGFTQILLPPKIAKEIGVESADDRVDILIDTDVTPHKIAVMKGTDISVQIQRDGGSRSVTTKRLSQFLPVMSTRPVGFVLETVDFKLAVIITIPMSVK